MSSTPEEPQAFAQQLSGLLWFPAIEREQTDLTQDESLAAGIAECFEKGECFPIEALRLVERAAEMVRFAEIGEVGGDHLPDAHGVPEAQALLEPLDRLGEIGCRHGQEPQIVKRMGLPNRHRVAGTGQTLLQRRFRAAWSPSG